VKQPWRLRELPQPVPDSGGGTFYVLVLAPILEPDTPPVLVIASRLMGYPCAPIRLFVASTHTLHRERQTGQW